MDPQAAEKNKLKILMRGLKDTIFGGRVRKLPTTVDGFVKEATNIERYLQARAVHYQRLPNVAVSALQSLDVGSSLAGILEMIRDITREEQKKLLTTAEHPAWLSVTEPAVKEVHLAL